MPAVVHSQQALDLDAQIPIVRGEAPLKPHQIFNSKGEKKNERSKQQKTPNQSLT